MDVDASLAASSPSTAIAAAAAASAAVHVSAAREHAASGACCRAIAELDWMETVTYSTVKASKKENGLGADVECGPSLRCLR